MKKIYKIISLVFAILFILISPITSYFSVNQVYAFTFESAMESELMKQIMIPTLISAGLVFSGENAINAAEEVYYDVKDWLYDQGFNWEFPEDPREPQGPKLKLGDVILGLTGGKVIYDAAIGKFKKIVEMPSGFFKLIKNWVDLKFDEGNNASVPGFIHVPYSRIELDGLSDGEDKILTTINLFGTSSTRHYLYAMMVYETGHIEFATWSTRETGEFVISGYKRKAAGAPPPRFLEARIRKSGAPASSGNILRNFYYYPFYNNEDYKLGWGQLFYTTSFVNVSNPADLVDGYSNTYGTPEIVDNPNYDWNNPYTNSKTITIPIETDTEGNPEVDSDGLNRPSIGTEWWVDKQPHEVTESDPSGIPQPEIPEIPDTDDDTSILITIGVLLQSLLRQITGIRNDTANIADKANDISEGIGNIGNGGDGTDVPTDFDWGDFKRFLDIFVIFIYFIVILILILVKLLAVVFFNLTSISANADLFNQYPTILAGVNYLKNLRVGGLSITVHQAFEYVFMIFFFIFIIKQIRKLYDSYVYEENERLRTNKAKNEG